MNQLRGEFVIALTDDLKVGCLMNMYALGIWCKEQDKALTDIQSEMTENWLASVPQLTWAGVRCYHLVNEQELPLGYDRFAALLGSCDWEELATNINDSLSLLDASKKKKVTRKK